MGCICPICSNEDKNYFFYLNGKLCCRKCLNFTGEKADSNFKVNKGYYTLEYELTDKQREASDFILKHIARKESCAINAVCGAGKTEIIYDTLKYCLNNGLKVGIAIPRKDVVVELQKRIVKDFNVTVISVYGGNHTVLEGDIIIFTTHQAFRYVNYFDILIIDEVDAFPFKGNKVLQNIVSKCSGIFVYLSATMPVYIEKDASIDKYYLNKRYHNFNLPIPKCKASVFGMRICLRRVLKNYNNKIVLVYFPTISLENKVAKFVRSDFFINSKTENREEVISQIKQMEKGVIFTTTILERGITIKDVQVIVYNADHKLFDKDTLIQISGRVGRNKNYPAGDIIFICKEKNKSIRAAIKTLKKYNE